MVDIQALESKRNAILEEMRSIRSMKRGTISEQFLKVPHKNKKEPVLRGPYYVFSRREGTRTVSKRLSKGSELEKTRKDIAEFKRFTQLCQEFVELTEKLGMLQDPNLGQEEKKRPKSKSRKMERSNVSSKGQPKPGTST